MKLLCPCGRAFIPSVFNGTIQLLCDRCVHSHNLGREDVAPCWIVDTSIYPWLAELAERPRTQIWPSARYSAHRIAGRNQEPPSGSPTLTSVRGSALASMRSKAVAGPLSPGARRG